MSRGYTGVMGFFMGVFGETIRCSNEETRDPISYTIRPKTNLTETAATTCLTKVKAKQQGGHATSMTSQMILHTQGFLKRGYNGSRGAVRDYKKMVGVPHCNQSMQAATYRNFHTIVGHN